MHVDDHDSAIALLRRVNYYRLSGYSYHYREIVDGVRTDNFRPGTRLSDVVALYEFDDRLRAATFAAIAPIELAIRALVGHELGRIDPCVHMEPSLLGSAARSGDGYCTWLKKYEKERSRSREEFVHHHQAKYGGRLPVWVATELLDWGSLTYLYDFAPVQTQRVIAQTCGLTHPQFRSWLKVLNVVRNTCAHHGRLFNRVHALTPKLPPIGRHPDLDSATTDWNRTFGRLTLIRFLADRLGTGRTKLLPAVVASFPLVKGITLTNMGVPENWQETSTLWA